MSAGLNVGLDYLPGASDFNPAAGDAVSPAVASLAVWFDAFTQNVDRTPRNPNLLLWHGAIRFIDHGAAMYFHHNWDTMPEKARSAFSQISHHVLLPFATDMPSAAAHAHKVLTGDALQALLAQVPDAFLAEDPQGRRQAYLEFFLERLQYASIFEEEALRAHERKL